MMAAQKTATISMIADKENSILLILD